MTDHHRHVRHFRTENVLKLDLQIYIMTIQQHKATLDNKTKARIYDDDGTKRKLLWMKEKKISDEKEKMVGNRRLKEFDDMEYGNNLISAHRITSNHKQCALATKAYVYVYK